MKTNCRIGKIKMKSGGVVHLLPSTVEPYCKKSVKHFSDAIDEDTLIAGFFIVRRDRTFLSGWSYDAGTTDVDLLGAVEMLKQDILEVEVKDV